MNQLQKRLLAGAGLVALMVVGASMDRSRISAQAPTVVTVSNTPLTVQGTVHIAGTTHAPLPVVINHAQTTLPVKVTDLPLVEAYHMHQFIDSQFVPPVVTFPAIPLGKRLVLQYVSAYVDVNFPSALADLILLNGNTPLLHVALNREASNLAPPGSDQYVASQSVTSYIDGGTIITVQPRFGSFSGGTHHSMDVILDGYLQDMP